MKEALEAIRYGKKSNPQFLSTVDGAKASDLLARNLEVQIAILATLERIEEKLE